MTSVRLRAAGPGDAEKVALLHADSWRRFYRGAYADSFLDGDVVADRIAVWMSRLATPANCATVVAEDAAGLSGFVHVAFDDDDQWGSVVDNLHVTYDRRRAGIGRALLTAAAEAVVERATGSYMYLWVLAQNTAAQQFYRACGANFVEKALVPGPGGDGSRLNGSPEMYRFVWPDASLLASSARAAGLDEMVRAADDAVIERDGAG
jgi:ribosomal protein S18 acetylase RimI-like enzyme